MPEPELRNDDAFHIIGFANEDVLSGALQQLTYRLGKPARSGTKLVEVYCLDSVAAPDPDRFKLYGNYLAVYFFNDTALALSHHHDIRLPPVMGKTTRAELPPGAATILRQPG